MLARLPVIENVMVAAQRQRGESPLMAMFWARSWSRQEASLREEALDLLASLGLQDHVERTSRLIARRVREIAGQGVTILVIAHNMGFLSSVADDVVVMAEGTVLTRGSLDYVRAHKEVVAAYLGVAGA